MKVIEFDKNGLYHFQLEDFISVQHAHPAVEIILATRGSFSIQANNQLREDITFAIIDKNTAHSINLKECQVQMIMLEHHDLIVNKILRSNGIVLSDGIYTSSRLNSSGKLLLSIVEDVSQMNRTTYDHRVSQCLDLIESKEIEFGRLMEDLCNEACLSESRISHLFKDNVGISPKKYLVWNKLKRAIKKVMSCEENLFSAGLEVGFYDQAHLSKAFKGMLGVPPSLLYNSRILQS